MRSINGVYWAGKVHMELGAPDLSRPIKVLVVFPRVDEEEEAPVPEAPPYQYDF